MTGDLDQSGGYPQYVRTWLGPTVGWALLQVQPERLITTPGALTVQPFDSRLLLKAIITPITLPDVVSWVRAPFQKVQSAFDRSLWIKDLNYSASANPITVNPFAGQTIDGLANFQIATNGLLLKLYPLSDLSGWYVEF